jgi:hypothetical protein
MKLTPAAITITTTQPIPQPARTFDVVLAMVRTSALHPEFERSRYRENHRCRVIEDSDRSRFWSLGHVESFRCAWSTTSKYALSR